MSECCDLKDKSSPMQRPKKKQDWLLWSTAIILLLAYLGQWLAGDWFASINYLSTFSASIFELINRMAWGLALGILFVGILDKIPRDLLSAALGKGGTASGIFRATLAGVLLDLCSHGILIIAGKLYKKGASLGQTMAFLIASPWNSISLTFVLWALIGIKWTLVILALSMAIAIFSGFIFEGLVKKGVLPKNPNTINLPEGYTFRAGFKAETKKIKFTAKIPFILLWDGLRGSRMILRWIFFGVIMAALIRTFISPESFQTFFGPTLGGLGLTIIVATILEVCSEGSAPIAADILTRAKSPGNAFAFLMTGVSTDYTEMLVLKESTKSWKIALFLPLVTLPQILILAWVLNQVSLA